MIIKYWKKGKIPAIQKCRGWLWYIKMLYSSNTLKMLNMKMIQEVEKFWLNHVM